MSILFMGGEQIDFDGYFNNTYTITDSAKFRSSYARAAVQCLGAPQDFNNNAQGSFAQPSADFWFTAQVSCHVSDSLSSGFLTFLVFNDGGQKRLGLQMNDQRQLRLVRYANGVTASVVTTTSTVAVQNNGVHKIDVHVTYATTGGFTVYVDQVKVMDYSGDITAGGSASLNGFGLSSFNTSDMTCWSECVAIERDSRTLMLKTHTPKAALANSEWTGTAADIAEVIPDDGTVVRVQGLDRVGRFSLDALPTDNLSVAGFKLSARVSRGLAGPQNIALGVTSGSDSAISDNIPVTTGWTNVSQIFDQHPNTGVAWTEADINAIEIDFKSR